MVIAYDFRYLPFATILPKKLNEATSTHYRAFSIRFDRYLQFWLLNSKSGGCASFQDTFHMNDAGIPEVNTLHGLKKPSLHVCTVFAVEHLGTIEVTRVSRFGRC